jgi:hypothetical protein
MKPVKQTRFTFGDKDEPPGNCWAACVASIFEVSLCEVPDEAKFWKPGMKPQDSWAPHEKEMLAWLYARGYVFVTAKTNQIAIDGPVERFQECYCILSGPSPRNPDQQHAVVSLGNKIIHDPHPSDDGLAGDPDKDWWYELLIPVGTPK